MFKLILAFLISTSSAALTPSDIAKTPIRNALLNPGAENGKVGWAVSTGSFTASNSTPLDGNSSFVWDASASTQTLSSAITVPEWLKGQNAVVSCQVRCATGTCTHSIRALVAGSSVASASITSSTTASPRATVNFIAPTSGAIGVELYANADEPSLKIDNCYIARADEWNLSQVSQASLYGSLTYPSTTNCTWNTTSSSYADFSADADCTASPTVSGGISAPTTKIPAARALNLPIGTYLVIASGEIGTTGGVADYRGIRIFDGTTSGVNVTANNGTVNGHFLSSIAATFTYTSVQSSVTFSIQGLSSGGSNIRVQNDGTPLTFYIYRFPSSTESAVRVDSSPMSWNGFHDSTCSWARTNTAYGDPTADATCTFTERTNRNAGTVTSYLSGSDKLPGIVMSILRVGMKMICTRFGSLNGSTGTLGYRLTDGTTVIFELNDSSQTTYKSQFACGIYNATSVGSKTFRLESKASSSSATISTEAGTPSVEWTVFDLDQSFPAPLIVGSVTSNSSGMERVERATVNCSSSSSITSQSGAWLSSFGNVSSGVCTGVIATSIFSGPPSCTVTRWSDGSATAIAKLNARPTSTSVAVRGYAPDSNANATTYDFDIICMGPR